MIIEIKSFISPDILDFNNFEPTDKESFSFLLEFVVGIKGKEGGDLFSIEISTPKWLLENFKKGDILFCRHRIIVFAYDINKIINEIENHFKEIVGDSWEEITKKISRIAHWEFEDYTPNY